jgi:Family of unknown function (DUF6455)
VTDGDKSKLVGAKRLTDVMSRVRTNVGQVLDEADKAVIAQAIATCRRCDDRGSCGEWIETHSEGEDNSIPDFCPNAAFLRRYIAT